MNLAFECGHTLLLNVWKVYRKDSVCHTLCLKVYRFLKLGFLVITTSTCKTILDNLAQCIVVSLWDILLKVDNMTILDVIHLTIVYENGRMNKKK
jgi:hypothetical protein